MMATCDDSFHLISSSPFGVYPSVCVCACLFLRRKLHETKSVLNQGLGYLRYSSPQKNRKVSIFGNYLTLPFSLGVPAILEGRDYGSGHCVRGLQAIAACQRWQHSQQLLRRLRVGSFLMSCREMTTVFPVIKS